MINLIKLVVRSLRKHQSVPPMRLGKANPSSREFKIIGDVLEFRCPSCSKENKNSIALTNIDPIAGTPLLCGKCRNINHVPSGFRDNPWPSNLKIVCGVKVPVEKYHEWYSHHPVMRYLLAVRKTEFLAQYCLLVFCHACLHQFPKSVMANFHIVQEAKKYGANQCFAAIGAGSAVNMHSLERGCCPKCGCTDLIAIMNDLPDI